jgi:hypothetical protein
MRRSAGRRSVLTGSAPARVRLIASFSSSSPRRVGWAQHNKSVSDDAAQAMHRLIKTAAAAQGSGDLLAHAADLGRLTAEADAALQTGGASVEEVVDRVRQLFPPITPTAD